MGADTLTDAKLWLGGYDLSGSMNEVALGYGAELKEATVFGDTGKRRLSGLTDVAVQANGYWDPTLDGALFDNLAVANAPFSIGAEGPAEGGPAFFFQSISGEYSQGEAVGEMFPFSVAAEGGAGGPLVRGTLMHNAVRTATANGTARQLGQVSATQKLYAALHVIAASGTLDVTVESDTDSGFGTAQTRITFGQKTAIGSEWATPVDGAINDDWWRIAWTIGGGSPSFDFVVVVGIQ